MKTLLSVGLVILVLGLLVSPLPVRAQINISEGSATLLSKPVTLTVEEAPLSKILRELSQQTGLKIIASPAVKDRTLSLSITKATAQDALSTICELGEWQWQGIEPAHSVVIEPQNLRIPSDPAYISRKMLSVVPNDLREFLGLNKPSRDLRDDNSAFIADNKKQTERDGYLSKQKRKWESLGREIGDMGFSAMKNDVYQPFSQFIESQQEAILRYLVFRILVAQGNELLQADPYPYVTDPSLTRLFIDRGGSLNLLCTYLYPMGEERTVGFASGNYSFFLKPGEGFPKVDSSGNKPK